MTRVLQHETADERSVFDRDLALYASDGDRRVVHAFNSGFGI